MSRPLTTTYGDFSTSQVSAATRHEAAKSSYDDLIDQYAAPYSRNSRHQTFTVQTPSSNPRDPSESFDHKPSYSIGKSLDDDKEDFPASSYPPTTLPAETDAEKQNVWSKLIPDSWACRLFVITVIVETIIDLAIEGDLLVRLQTGQEDGLLSQTDQTQAAEKMPVYLSIFALAHVFQLVMAVDAVYARNTLQFICLTVFNLLFLLYAVIQIGEIQDYTTSTSGFLHISVKVLTTVIPCVISAAEIAYIALGWKIYNEFGWKVYKFLGADRRIKKMFASYQIFICLIKFDVFLWVGFCVQFIWLVLTKHTWEYYLTCAALPLSVVLLVEGHLAVRHENKLMMWTFLSGCGAALVYFVYKLIKVLVLRKTTSYVNVWESLATFSIIAIILLIVTIVFSVIVMRNFGKGLKASMTRGKTHARTQGSQHLGRATMSMNLNRMSIE
ncbi:hypothetical protein CONPUDRAFT_78856 [Coniophora puteana RWD-64-598 SS2]|uniref:Uncharacterized protein n=1 Tax=Coniophora puteana (strain RWD-64-598) TaxID=741705 RepID=A0A5M3N569_CONPW|nr:uncharacterized protein CONPUDRAFT_78856 [Coniophora puteana RWD-64-598 SS2]EIW86533.1 hypothetical protein CONPUDRAFT_78856 [Coniophora puteana RWD-64-598 SS2]